MADTLDSLTNGMEMGKLGEFAFYIDKNKYKKISQSLTATHGSFTPIKGQKLLTDSGGYERKITLNGVLVVQPTDALKPLEDYLIARDPIRFTTLQHDLDVVINSLNTTEEHFLDDGRFTVQTYNLSLEESFDELQ